MQLLEWPDTTKANPRASTILEVLSVIQAEARGDALPLSLAEIGRRMAAKKTRPEVIRVSVELLESFGLAKRGSKGVISTDAPSSVAKRATEPL